MKAAEITALPVSFR